ncbi:MAG: ImmA/IrrE family metallo-endopeptidase [Rickettsiales bacterium]
MIKIDRMELADIGHPIKLAQAVINQLPDIQLPIPVRDIAMALDIIEIKPINVSGFEGGLITFDDKSSGCILVKENSQQRQRFTIGHELGHYLNPWHIPNSSGKFMCNSKDMITSNHKPADMQQKMEVEANQFAAELLIPSKFMQKDIRLLKSPEIDHIVSLASKYDVSKESMGRRYIEFQDEPCALVFSKNGKVSYTVQGQYFPKLAVWKDDIIPTNTVTKLFNGQYGNSSEWQECESDIWLSNNKKYESVYEQVLVQKDGYRITLLTLGDEVDEDEEGLETSYSKNFR